MHPPKPGRRLGNVSGRTLLADRLRDELLEEITSSQVQPGTKLPSEGQLAKRFNVSRATVRDAVGALVEAGYVTRRRGSGSYVTERRRMPHGLDSTLSYLSMIETAGARAGVRILEIPVPHRRRSGGESKVSGTLRGTFVAGARILATLVRVALE